VGRQAASTLNHLGIQDAPRKRRDSSRAPGAWAGVVLRTNDKGVHVLLSQEKWERTKAQLKEIQTMLEREPSKMSRKRLEEIRGFLVYVTRTYIGMSPYLIGLHMTIDSWREGRDSEGWRTKEEVMVTYGEEAGWTSLGSDVAQPTLVGAVPRLAEDIEATEKLCETDTPPLR
jgi:hypothetical protein